MSTRGSFRELSRRLDGNAVLVGMYRSARPRRSLHASSADDLGRAQGHSKLFLKRRICVIHDHDRHCTGLVGSLVSQ